MRHRIFFILALFALGLMISSCKKKEITGPKGEAGDQGIGGNANISGSTVFTITSSEWVVDTAANCRRVNISMPQITKDVISHGAVKVYMQSPPTFSDAAWTELPFVKGDLFTQFGFEQGRLYLDFINIEGPVVGPPATNVFRLVIINEI